jgi:hypothetical protein
MAECTKRLTARRDPEEKMFGWFKKTPEPPPTEAKVAHQRPGEAFPWPKGWQLTALDEAVIAVPAALIGDNEVIGSVIHCGDGVKVNLPSESSSTPGARIMLWLQAGQSVWLSKSCQAVVVPKQEGDTKVRRLRLTEN